MIVTFTQLTSRQDSLELSRRLLKDVTREARGFDGSLGAHLLVNEQTEGKWVLIEEWETTQHHAAFRDWSAAAGAWPKLNDALAESPDRTITSTVDIA